MEDSSDIGGVVEQYQVIPAINKLDENYYEEDFYPAEGEPAYETGDATSIGEGEGEYMTAGGGSHDDFMNELGETDEAFANAFGDGIKRFGKNLRNNYKRRPKGKRPKTFKDKLKRGAGFIPGVAMMRAAKGAVKGRPRRKPRRGGPPPRRSNPATRGRRGPIGGNAPKRGASADVREMDAQIRKFASEPITNFTGDATKYGNGWGEWKTAGGGSRDGHSNADGGKGAGLSKSAKIAIGVGAAALVGTIIILVIKARKK